MMMVRNQINFSFRLLLLALSAIVFLICRPLLADVGANEKRDSTLEQDLIDGDREISNWFDGVADGLDLFLVGKRLTSERNESYIRLKSSASLVEAQGLNTGAGLDASLRLPNFEKLWQIKFTSYDELQEARNLNKGYLNETPRERNVGATVSFFRKLGNIRTIFQPRIELHDPLNVSHSLIFESVADYKFYRINPKLEFFADATKGTGTFHALNFNFKLNKIYSLTFTNESQYEEKQNKFSAANGFSLGQSLSENKNIAYGIMFGSHNRPSYHLDMYSLSISWNHMPYKKVLDYQIIPHLDFTYDQHFRGRVGLTVNLNIAF